MDHQTCVNLAVATAQRAAHSTESWAVCDGCVRRLAECPGVNLRLQRKGERQSKLNAWKGIEKDQLAYDTSSSNLTWEELRSAADNGCSLCDAVYNWVRDEIDHPERLTQSLLDTIDFREESDYEQLQLILKEHTGGADRDQYRHNLTNANGAIQSVTLTFDRLHDAGELKILLEVFLHDTSKEPGTTALSVQALRWGFFPTDGSMDFPRYHETPIYIADSVPDKNYANKAIHSYTANLSVGGSDAFVRATSWIAKCRRTCEHSHSTSAISTDRPGRLVDVMPRNGTTSDSLTIVAGDSPGLGDYVALSYCWGQREQPMATTTVNLKHRFEEGLHLSDLPHTIRDAVLVCRRLGFRYIWVDSLCILQDSSADKKTEIKKMAGIFEGSFLTIVAASASIVTQGFLETREKEKIPEINGVPFWDQSGRVGRVSLQGQSPSLSDPDPVHYRAWTLEELLLSPRRLVYSGRQLLWTCRGFQETDGGWGEKEIFYLDSDLDPSYMIAEGQRDEPEEFELAPPFPLVFKNYWASLLRQYTGRRLTHTRDRLNAVHGIVSRVCDQTGLHYDSGIWREYAVSCLCWHYVSESGNEDDLTPANIKTTIPSAREREISCATWSWGSVADPVCLPEEPQTISPGPYSYDLARFVRFAQSSGTEDSSQIVLRGRCLQLQDFELTELESTCAERDESNLEFFPSVDGHMLCTAVQGDGNADLVELNLLVWPDNQQIWETPQDNMRFMGLRSFGGVLRGVVLIASQNNETFERIGYFEAMKQEEGFSDDEDMELDIPTATPDFPTQVLGLEEIITIK